MKKFLIVFAISILYLSCTKDRETVMITEFSESITINLEPYKNYPYSMMNIWIKGKVNDTILIKLNDDDSKPIMKLSGEISKRWYTDYYGEGPVKLIFDPYKATEGELEIDFKL